MLGLIRLPFTFHQITIFNAGTGDPCFTRSLGRQRADSSSIRLVQACAIVSGQAPSHASLAVTIKGRSYDGAKIAQALVSAMQPAS
jgi:hypothetical protein